MSAFDPRDLPMVPKATDRCLPPVHVNEQGRAVPDPYDVLHLTDRPSSREALHNAYRDAILAHPPEHEPKAAQLILEARDRLSKDDQFDARHLGVLHVPDPAAWGLPVPSTAEDSPLTPTARLLGQAVLYTLVEEALWTLGLGDVYNEQLAALTSVPTEDT
jgi:hypothetical protein